MGEGGLEKCNLITGSFISWKLGKEVSMVILTFYPHSSPFPPHHFGNMRSLLLEKVVTLW